MLNKSILYALSADPITFGHINIIDRVLKTYNHVLVGIGINPAKKYTFSLEKREELTRKVLIPYGDRITVKSYHGLLADLAYENQITNIVRGVRNSADFDFECMLADINQGFRMGLETYLMVADQKLSHISSSAVKELQLHQANNVEEYVPLVVKEALELEISGQYRIGVTGGIGVGKSYVSNMLQQQNKEQIHVIDMDEIGRYILRDSEEAIHIQIRRTILEHFGESLRDGDKIYIHKLLKFLFDAETNIHRTQFEKIMAEPTMHVMRKRLHNLKGIILINSAIFVEVGICNFVNNNFIFVTCNDDVRRKRLEKRGYDPTQIANRLKAQLTQESKLESIRHLITSQGCGSIIEVDNTSTPEKICTILKILSDKYNETISKSRS